MADASATIERFQKMAEADPNNELGHFSLGRALLDAGRFSEAAASFQRVLQINPNMGKVYQLLGTALLRQGQREQAIAQWTAGIKIAQSRGETMPKNEMIAALKELGAPVPEEATVTVQQAVGEGQVLCRRCGRVAARLPSPPMRNAFGQKVFEHICADCWREAIGQGTKVINELRLPLDDPQAGKIWDQHIKEFLNLSDV